MAFIAFLGCDGSGKSAVIEAVCTRAEAQGLQVWRGHWRPKFPSGGDKPRIETADDPHGTQPRGFLMSVVKLVWLLANWWLGWFRNLRQSARTGLLIFDRYHADIIADPRRYRYGGPEILARIASRCMPQPDHVFFLDATPDVLLSRKQEVSREALEAGRKAYLALASVTPTIQVVDASRPLEVVVEDVLVRIGLGHAE